MGLKVKTAISLKWNTLATVITVVIGILQVAILTRLLDKADFGLIAIATMVIAFTDIFAELGLTAALIHKQNITQEEYSSVYWLNISMSIVVFLITVLIAPLVADFYKQSELTLIVRLLSLKIVLSAFGKIFQTIKTKNLEFEFISKVRILTSIIGLLTSTLLAWLGCGVMSLVWGQLAQISINQAVYTIAGMHQMRIKFHFSFSEVKDVLKIGGYQIGTQVLDYIASRLDVFLIGKFFTMDQLGVYNIAKELITKPFLMINTISSSVFSAAFAKIQDNVKAVISNYSKLIKTVTMMAAPLYAAMFIFADLLVGILYAPSFAEVAVYIRILSIVGITSSITSQGSAVMVAYGRTDLGLHWTITRIVMTTIVLLATAGISLYAVAWGQTGLSILCLFVYFFIVISPMLKEMTFAQYFGPFCDISLYIALLTLPFSILNAIYDINILLQILMGVVFALLCYFYYKRKHNEVLMEIMGLLLKKKL